MSATSNTAALLLYAVPLAIFVAIYVMRRRRSERESASRLSEANASGMNEPASLHPRIDPRRCLGSAA